MAQHPARLLLVALVAAWVGILLTAGDSPAQLYRYVDQNGNTVFTDNPPSGVVAETVEKAQTAPPPVPQAAAAKDEQNRAQPPEAGGTPPAPPSEKIKTTIEKTAKEEADKETDRIMAEDAARKQAERQLRIEEAERLEKEAATPVQPTQENINRQMKLLQDAQRLREMP